MLPGVSQPSEDRGGCEARTGGEYEFSYFAFLRWLSQRAYIFDRKILYSLQVRFQLMPTGLLAHQEHPGAQANREGRDNRDRLEIQEIREYLAHQGWNS